MKYELCEGVAIEKVENHSILITTAGDAVILNEAATHMLDLILMGNDIEVVEAKVVDIFEVDKAILKNDIESLIADLVTARLLKSIYEETV